MEIEISVFVRPGPTPGENKGWNTKTIAMDFPFAAAVASIDAATWLTKAVLKSLVDQAMVASTEQWKLRRRSTMEIRIEIVMLDEELKSKWTHNVAFPIETADKYLDVTSRIMNIGLHKTFYDLKGKGGLNE